MPYRRRFGLGRRRRRPRWIPFERMLAGNRRVFTLNDHLHDSDEEAPGPDETEILQVTEVDLDIKNNVTAHRTNEYDITDSLVYDSREELVIRRGQNFNVNVEFNRPYDKVKDDLRLVFQFGKRPIPSKGTHAEFILSDRDDPNEWGAYIKSQEGNSLSLVVMTPPTCFVGKWSFKIDVVKRENRSVNVYRYTHQSPIYILFNPWCRDDQVYMHEENLLQEYILNDTGKIYRGSYRKISPCPWSFGQFDGDILDCCILLLEMANIPDHSRGNPIVIARKISQMVNEADDSGVLVGNWSGDYTGGTSPLEWTGSVAILDQFYKTRKPVSYGQCWVFSAVVTTVCRALGIPARSVTNFASAHDTDGSITIDNHFTSAGESLEELDTDSVWNFHVWNDVWMARPDLPTGYGGWQAIDATPQETSEGIYCMGPMSLLAIKRGEVNLPYDGPFVFAEVNADRVYWIQEDDGSMRKVHIQTFSVGRFISTKKALQNSADSWRELMRGGDPDREDVTDQYKYPEGSNEERAAVRRANLHSTREGLYETTAQDLKFDLTTNPNTLMGDKIACNLKITNTGDSKRTVNGTLALTSMYYTGVTYKPVKKQSVSCLELGPKEEKIVAVDVDVDEYLDKLMDHCICKLSCICIVAETNQTHAEIEELRLRKPHLTIKAPESATVGKKFEVVVSFENPLPVTLTRCSLRAEGPGLQRPVIYKQQNVGEKQTFVGKFDMTPVKAGAREIVVSFNCAQIYAVNVSHPIKIQQ